MKKTNTRRSVLGIVSLSLAVGLLLYWVMFINVLPRTLRPEASTILPLISAIVGSSICGLLYLGLRGVLPSLRGTPLSGGRATSAPGLVLRRDALGKVIAVEFSDEPPVVRRAPSTIIEGSVEEGAEGLASASIKRTPEKWLGALKALILASLAVEAYLIVICALGTWVPVYAIPSQSMAPTLNVGDLVLVRGVDPLEVKEGDIIVFNVPPPYDRQVPSPVIHRVVGVEVYEGKPYFKTKGDNPRAGEDPWVVPAENVVGIYVAKVPYLGYAVLALKSPLGMGLAVSALALWILYPRLKRLLGGGGERP